MKKLITIILSTAIAFSAFAAKDLNTLVAEYAPIVDGKSFKEHSAESGAYIEANRNDLLDAFNSWKNTDYAKFGNQADVYLKATGKEKEKFLEQRKLFARLADYSGEEMSASDACILRITTGSTVFFNAHQDAYARSKANDFTTEGVKIPYERICAWAYAFGDGDVFDSLPIAKCADFELYLKAKTSKLRRMADVSAAISQCEELENWYLDRNKQVPTIVQATLASLTKKLARSKLK